MYKKSLLTYHICNTVICCIYIVWKLESRVDVDVDVDVSPRTWSQTGGEGITAEMSQF